MNVENKLQPSPAQGQAFFFGADEGPFVMVNLLKFRDRALYPDGSDTDLSGFDAYKRYMLEVAGLIEKAGGTPGFNGPVTGLMIGEVESLWDMVALVEYPNLAAMLAMVQSPAYQAIAVHREAGLAGQINIKAGGSLRMGSNPLTERKKNAGT